MNDIFNIIENVNSYFGLSGGASNYHEPDNISEAIKLHEQRILYLNAAMVRGFTTVSEYKKYLDALETVNRYENARSTTSVDNSDNNVSNNTFIHAEYQ